MTIQLPAGAAGAAAGVLTYSLVSAMSGVWMMWLLWIHDEGQSYVMLMTVSSFISTMASVVQQCHTAARWTDIKLAQQAYSVANAGKPEIVLAGNSIGLDLVLFYIQWYGYNVTALLVASWAATMTHSVYGFFDIRRLRRRTNMIASTVKIFVFIFPALLISLLQVDAIQNSLVAFLIVADMSMFVALCLGSICMLLILGKYIYTRHKLISWQMPYGRRGQASRTNGTTASANPNSSTATPNNAPTPQRESIYDRWLIVRFAIAFFCLSVFQLVTILFQLAQREANNAADSTAAADLSAARAKGDFTTFMPGVTASLLVFVVFGTTRQFRNTMYETLVCARFRKEEQERPVEVARLPTLRSSRMQHGQKESSAYSVRTDSTEAIVLETMDPAHRFEKDSSPA